MTKLIWFAAITIGVVVTAAATGNSQAEGTPEQRWACTSDAFKFCGNEIPDVPVLRYAWPRTLRN